MSIGEQPALIWLAPSGFLIVFAAFWIAITSLLARISGWRALQRAYPDRPEYPLARLRLQSGRMGGQWGMPVSYSGCLTFDRCPSGIRVAVWRLFGLFEKPFFVPWDEIAATGSRRLFVRVAVLRFARWPEGELTMRRRTFDRLAAMTPLKLVEQAAA